MTTPAAVVLAELEARGIRAYRLDAETVRLIPKAAVTPEIRAKVKAAKVDLLAVLPPVPAIPPDPTPTPAPCPTCAGVVFWRRGGERALRCQGCTPCSAPSGAHWYVADLDEEARAARWWDTSGELLALLQRIAVRAAEGPLALPVIEHLDRLLAGIVAAYREHDVDPDDPLPVSIEVLHWAEQHGHPNVIEVLAKLEARCTQLVEGDPASYRAAVEQLVAFVQAIRAAYAAAQAPPVVEAEPVATRQTWRLVVQHCEPKRGPIRLDRCTVVENPVRCIEADLATLELAVQAKNTGRERSALAAQIDELIARLAACGAVVRVEAIS